MRSNIINSSIANVFTRFVKATSMLRDGYAPLQQWHLNLCAGPLSGGNPGTDLLFRNMSPVMSGTHGTDMPGSKLSLAKPGNVVSIRRPFQRLG